MRDDRVVLVAGERVLQRGEARLGGGGASELSEQKLLLDLFLIFECVEVARVLLEHELLHLHEVRQRGQFVFKAHRCVQQSKNARTVGGTADAVARRRWNSM